MCRVGEFNARSTSVDVRIDSLVTRITENEPPETNYLYNELDKI